MIEKEQMGSIVEENQSQSKVKTWYCFQKYAFSYL